ncbi:hypothetical protein EHS25_002744 [Saitozyma podzolica]|uniref:CBM1 domain-containing protein n=1 Tax=Saitozyma podzolica TaxID=1890683 RepID=A0A427YDA8_9TREE|nr:hypothetical protein EHS25_002744 [Saitozyma podzolica]
MISTLLSLLPLLPALAGSFASATTLWEMDNASGTFYYDLTETTTYDQCGGSGKAEAVMWAWDSGINNSTTLCETKMVNPPSLASIGTNRIVAMNANVLNADLAGWCGKEVKVFQDGAEVVLDEGPFVLFDGCGACESAMIVDFSVKAAVMMMPGQVCTGANPSGLTVQVVDTQIWDFPRDDSWQPTAASQPMKTSSNAGITGVGGSGGNAAAASVTTGAAAVATSSAGGAAATAAASAATGASSAAATGSTGGTLTANQCSPKGATQCSGGENQICNYVTSDVYLEWQTVPGSCTSKRGPRRLGAA